MLSAKVKSVHSSSNASKSVFIVDDCENSSSSCEEFVDSSGISDNDGNGGLISFSQETKIICDQPTLESLLDNLNLDKPMIGSYNQNQISLMGQISRGRENSISWLSSAFRWEPSTESNYKIDRSSTEHKPIIIYASKAKLIEKLTTILGKDKSFSR